MMLKHRGMRTFLFIWVGQLLSQIGTGITRFALLIWAYQQSEGAMAVALLAFFAFVPIVLISPFAGVWIDRLDRRKILWLADAGSGLMTLTLYIFYATGQLEIWHLYMAQTMSGISAAFQTPAYIAVSTQLLPKAYYARASGLRAMVGGGANILTPILAGLLLPFIGIGGVMLFDIVTFMIAISTLLLITIPPLSAENGVETAVPCHFWQEMGPGFIYIGQRPGLLGLMILYGLFNFLDALTWFSVLPIMILARSGGDEMLLASIQGAFGVAYVVGGFLVSIWGGPRRKIHTFLVSNMISFFVGGVLIATGTTAVIWVLAAGLAAMFVPLIRSSNEALWQAKVPPRLQGRVMSVHNMAQQAMTPIGILLSGFLADRWFEPAMRPGGTLFVHFSSLVGSGPGAGMALMFLATAVLALVVGLVGYLTPAIRYVEDNLPDHDRQILAQPL